MAYLDLINNSSPYKFESLGELNFDKSKYGEFVQSTDFPIGTKYVLTKGKFPLNYNDDFKNSGSYHTLNNNIKVKITSFDEFCSEERFKNPQSFPKNAICRIQVEKIKEKHSSSHSSKSSSKSSSQSSSQSSSRPSRQLSSKPSSTNFKNPFSRKSRKIVPFGGRKSNRRKSNRRR
uniref:Uncharacterized protein n=1 Tax=viral metagenome TaxID=1070528 RepID=A0A6C0EJL7_9ZZZZ